ncbi:hypothetical protein KJ564_16175 [bacterium]|nr:hypothetical protein [bacterium]
MKCPSCKGDIQWSYKGQTCPSCGDPLPKRKAFIVEFFQRSVEFSEDRGFFFWLLVFVLFLIVTAALEHLLGAGKLKIYLDRNKFISLLTMIYVAAHLKLIRNIHTISRPGYPGAYWVDRLIIKKMRRGTNVMLALGVLTSLIVLGPFNIFSMMPAYFVIISLFTALFWSIESFRMDDREFQDAKVRSYFVYLGVIRLRRWRQASGAYLITLVVSGGVFFGLSNVPNLYWNIRMNPFVMETVDIFTGLFDWMPLLWPEG